MPVAQDTAGILRDVDQASHDLPQRFNNASGTAVQREYLCHA